MIAATAKATATAMPTATATAFSDAFYDLAIFSSLNLTPTLNQI